MTMADRPAMAGHRAADPLRGGAPQPPAPGRHGLVRRHRRRLGPALPGRADTACAGGVCGRLAGRGRVATSDASVPSCLSWLSVSSSALAMQQGRAGRASWRCRLQSCGRDRWQRHTAHFKPCARSTEHSACRPRGQNPRLYRRRTGPRRCNSTARKPWTAGRMPTRQCFAARRTECWAVQLLLSPRTEVRTRHLQRYGKHALQFAGLYSVGRSVISRLLTQVPHLCSARSEKPLPF